ncbi:MAG: PEP-CTERM sorting domain-containing protein [Planctomycetota bacterium]
MRIFQMMVACVSVLLAMSENADSAVINYTITVSVTAAPNAPGSFASNPWSFGQTPTLSTPATFVGTFEADDSVVGPISNLVLSIGGLDIATSHPLQADNSFDPINLILTSFWIDSYQLQSGVIFGNVGSGAPANYAVAIQNTNTPPLDSFHNINTQNWVGTYTIAPSTQAVPEPSTLAIFGIGAGIAGLKARRRKQTV